MPLGFSDFYPWARKIIFLDIFYYFLFFFIFNIFIGVYLLYNGVLVSAL